MILPKIIDIKDQFTSDGFPYELLLWDKLNKGIELGLSENNDLKNLIDFYYEQISFYNKTVPSNLQKEDIKDLETHFRKVFNISFLLSNGIHSNIFYRAVVNRDILRMNERLQLISHLSNPPEEIIRSKGVYGRANTPNNSVLYVSVDEATTMTELIYEAGDLITVSRWRQEKSFNILPIILDFKYVYQQDYITRTIKAYELLRDKLKTPAYDLMLAIHKFLANEFSKVVINRIDYLYSANFALNFFNNEVEAIKPSFIGLLYPGVGCDYKNFNLVFDPRLIGDNLRLIGAKEIRIKEKFDFRTSDGTINKHDTTGIVTGFKHGKLIWNN